MGVVWLIKLQLDDDGVLLDGYADRIYTRMQDAYDDIAHMQMAGFRRMALVKRTWGNHILD